MWFTGRNRRRYGCIMLKYPSTISLTAIFLLFARRHLTTRRSTQIARRSNRSCGRLRTLAEVVSASTTNQSGWPERAHPIQVTKGGLILGCVETKPIGENLDRVLKSDQITRYKNLSQNIILTDYLHFVWINKNSIQRGRLCHATDLESPRFRLHEDRVGADSKLLHAFFSTAPEGIGRAEQLALALASRSKLLRDYFRRRTRPAGTRTPRRKTFRALSNFRDQVFHELMLKEFADAYAQMLAYGLFLARLNSDTEPVTLHMPCSSSRGRSGLFGNWSTFWRNSERMNTARCAGWSKRVLSIVNGLDLFAIHEDLSFRQRKAISHKLRASDEEKHRVFERDPFIYFYEAYLKAYDPAMRRGRGVYYTPPPIVNFIVRAVDEILKTARHSGGPRQPPARYGT
jgi:hypothetical protein